MLRYLQFEAGQTVYLCPEEAVERVVLVSEHELYPTGFGSGQIRYLYPYNDMMIPLFDLSSLADGMTYVVVIVKKMINLAGFIVDRVRNLITIDGSEMSRSLSVPGRFASRAVMHGNREYYFLNINSLFEGKEHG